MQQQRPLVRPYGRQTLVDNWLEERADIKHERIQKPLPSQYDHYFNSIYECSYGTIRGDPPRSEVQNLEIPRAYAFPGHQPEFDLPGMKASVNTYETEYRAGYCSNCRCALAPNDPAWSTTTKVCLHCRDRTYSVDPKPEPYTLTVDYRQDPAAKDRCAGCVATTGDIK